MHHNYQNFPGVDIVVEVLAVCRSYGDGLGRPRIRSCAVSRASSWLKKVQSTSYKITRSQRMAFLDQSFLTLQTIARCHVRAVPTTNTIITRVQQTHSAQQTPVLEGKGRWCTVSRGFRSFFFTAHMIDYFKKKGLRTAVVIRIYYRLMVSHVQDCILSKKIQKFGGKDHPNNSTY